MAHTAVVGVIVAIADSGTGVGGVVVECVVVLVLTFLCTGQ